MARGVEPAAGDAKRSRSHRTQSANARPSIGAHAASITASALSLAVCGAQIHAAPAHAARVVRRAAHAAPPALFGGRLERARTARAIATTERVSLEKQLDTPRAEG